jgi:ADP-ribose pyrophosphatase YjhB (NUDIX family)
VVTPAHQNPPGAPRELGPSIESFYNDPERDPRSVVTTRAFLWRLPDVGPDPELVADAGEPNDAHWREISSLVWMWADHRLILDDLLRLERRISAEQELHKAPEVLDGKQA